MALFLATTPSAGICGPRLQYGDGDFQHGAFRFPGLTQVLLDLFPLEGIRGAHRLHGSRLNGRYPASAWHGRAPFAVDFVLGAALCIRREVIERIGGLDDGYFMYCEEMDWCLRCRQAGWGVYALPIAVVVHHAGQSSRQVRWDAYERLWRSRVRFYQKHRAAYPPGFLTVLRGLLRMTAAWRSRQARRRLAAGTVTHEAVARELAAYATLARL
jgi:GT2 family glycosyltransferase